jgi:hypothetical protein
MPHNIKVIQATDFIRAKPEGKTDLDFHVLVDTRRVTGHLTATELWYLADRLGNYRSTFENRTAIICPETRFDHSRFLPLCAENNGFNIQAFTSYEEAMQ